MKKLLFAGLVLALCMPMLAMAQSAFDGTWKVDLSKAHATGKPVVVTLKNGIYHCTCTNPPLNLKADGEDHAVSGYPSFDTAALKVVDDHTIQGTYKKAGKVVTTETLTVAADGKTATEDFTDDSGSSPVTGKIVYARVAKGAPGSHAMAGSWQFKQADNVSDNGLMITYKVDGDSIAMTEPTGNSYTAKMDGTEAPFHGDPDITTISVKKLGKNTLRTTTKHDGKVVAVRTLTVAADGKTMKVVSHNMQTNRSMTYIADKQ